MAFSVSPVGTGESVSAAVAEAVRVVRASGLAYETTAMFTTVEGDFEEAMHVVMAAVAAVHRVAPRVSLVLKADLRDGVTDALHAKVAAVDRQLSEG